MSGVQIGQPPLNVPVVDANGYPTRVLVEFLHLMWQRTGAADDNDDFILKLLTGGRYPNPKPPEQEVGERYIHQPPTPSGIAQAGQAASIAQMMAIMNQRTSVDPDQVKRADDAKVPSGGIIMWSGSVASIPDGWALCDGRNGTPDLTDVFVIGAGGTYSPGDTGGSSQFTGNTGSSNTGASVSTATSEVEPVGTPGTGVNALTSATLSDPGHQHYETIDTLPPYYALALIMKL